MKKILMIFFLIGLKLHAVGIAFVHIGDRLPSYLEVAVRQARLFNPDIPIFVVASQKALNSPYHKLGRYSVTKVAYETLPKTAEHLFFLENTDMAFGLFRFASERLLYLYDLMVEYGLSDLFHLENDNMLYIDVCEFLPRFQSLYPALAVTFDNEHRCIPGFVYIANKSALQKLAHFLSIHMRGEVSEMHAIASFKDSENGDCIDWLPIVPSTYAKYHQLVSLNGDKIRNVLKASNHFSAFASVFDAAAIGQYLDGGDRRCCVNAFPGFINESSVFNPSFCEYGYSLDEKGRKIPQMKFKGEVYPINNLHIHSKRLERFRS